MWSSPAQYPTRKPRASIPVGTEVAQALHPDRAATFLSSLAGRLARPARRPTRARVQSPGSGPDGLLATTPPGPLTLVPAKRQLPPARRSPGFCRGPHATPPSPPGGPLPPGRQLLAADFVALVASTTSAGRARKASPAWPSSAGATLDHGWPSPRPWSWCHWWSPPPAGRPAWRAERVLLLDDDGPPSPKGGTLRAAPYTSPTRAALCRWCPRPGQYGCRLRALLCRQVLLPQSTPSIRGSLLYQNTHNLGPYAVIVFVRHRRAVLLPSCTP